MLSVLPEIAEEGTAGPVTTAAPASAIDATPIEPPADVVGAPSSVARPEAAATPDPTLGPLAEASEAGPAVGLITDDTSTELAPGQLRKSEFLDLLEAVVRAEADAELAGTAHSTDGCPYLTFWFDFYRRQSGRHIERALHRYAPETRVARSAADATRWVAARVRRGVEHWAHSGEVVGVPQEAPHPTAAELAVARSGKAPLAGRANDPAAAQARLGVGRPLESRVRSPMERALGQSFSNVRLHTGAMASRLTSEQHARALTVGDDVAFATGEYRPGTPVGDALIAHELAHVAQQQERPSSETPDPRALESDADRSASLALSSLRPGAPLAKPPRRVMPQLRTGLRIQRCKRESSEQQPQAAAPKLTKKTVRGPTASDCGGFEWVVQWELNRKTRMGGWVVQKVELPHDVKDCKDKAVDPGKAGGMDPTWYPLWEAWPINNGQKVTTYAEGGDPNDDTYGSPGLGANTKGSVTVKGTAEYYDGLKLPGSFKVTNAAPTWILPATTSDPGLTGGSGSIEHTLKATWDCCGADKSTSIATT